MTHEDSSLIHQDAKLTLVSPGLLGSGLITLRSQFAPTDKQEIHNGGGSDDGGRLPREHRTEQTLSAPPFVSVGEVLPHDPTPPPGSALASPFRCLSCCRGYLERSWFCFPRGCERQRSRVRLRGRPRYAHSAVLAVDPSTAGPPPPFLWRWPLHPSSPGQRRLFTPLRYLFSGFFHIYRIIEECWAAR